MTARRIERHGWSLAVVETGQTGSHAPVVLLSNSRPDLVALEGYGLTITDHMEIPE